MSDTEVKESFSVALRGASRLKESRDSPMFVTLLCGVVLFIAIDFLLVPGEPMVLALSSTIKGKDFWLNLMPVVDRPPCFERLSSLSSAGRETREPKTKTRAGKHAK